jgi:hypothetical protein
MRQMLTGELLTYADNCPDSCNYSEGGGSGGERIARNTTVQQYSLLPNPNDGNMQLMQLKTDVNPVTIKVYNQVGQLVSVSTTTFEGNIAALSLSHIVPGLYYITLQDASGETYKLSFVKK